MPKKRLVLKKTKIVATVGPASENLKTLEEMIQEGMNVARVNFSHGTYEDHEKQINLIKEARKRQNTPIAIMLDTKGPEIRTGLLKNGDEVILTEGQTFVLTTEELDGDNTIVSISYEGLPGDVKPGDQILVDDGSLDLRVEAVDGKKIITNVVTGGTLGEHKSLNLPNVVVNLPGLTDKDINDLKFGIQQGVDFIAASFVRRPDDVLAIREVLDNNNGSDIKIISKIESQEGVYNFDKILDLSDGIMVARGDLGVEVPAKDVPVIQKRIIMKCNNDAKPVIIATQMLDSMIHNPRPTRAEVADVANAVFDGADAIMLSGETAVGAHPVEVVKTMADIASVAEVADEFRLNNRLKKKQKGITNSVCEAAISMSVNLKANSVIAATASGDSARDLSKFKPDANIFATSFRNITIRQLCLSWGVFGIYVPQVTDSDKLVRESVKAVKEKDYIHEGDRAIVVAGIPVGASSVTNMIRVIKVGNSQIKGKANGRKDKVIGIARQMRVQNRQAEENFREGDILIVPRLTSNNMYLADLAGAIITEQKEEVSKSFLKQLNEKPVITGVKNVFENIEDGRIITVDTEEGVIRQGIK